MHIIFVNPPTDNPYPKPPLGLLSVATACQDAGHDVRILDADLLKLSCGQVVEQVVDADLVGLTAMTPTYETTNKIACLLKAETGVRTMIGGVHASLFPEEIRATGLFDLVVSGDGERVVEALGTTASWQRTVGLTYVDIPTPDYGLIDVPAYRPRHPHGQRTPWTAVHTSRGCPSRCTFCSKGVFGSTYRAMPSLRLYSLLEMLVTTHGIRDITFYDDEFMLDRARLAALCSFLMAGRLDLTWTCEARVSSVRDANTVTAMWKAGCRLVYFGLESGNRSILRTLRKGTTLDQARRAVAVCHRAGLQVAAYFMLGAPGETERTIQDTLDFAEELVLDHAQFSICTPLPGSELYEQYGKNGGVDHGRYLGNGARPVMVQGEVADMVVAAVEEVNRRWARV